MAQLRQVVLGQAGHFHHRVVIQTVIKHRAGHFKFAFFDTALFAQLNAFLTPFDAATLKALLNALLFTYRKLKPFQPVNVAVRI